MKLRILTLALLLASISAFARNAETKVAQVKESVDVPANVDYIITDATPFGNMGSVNITDLDHSVVIIQKIKPSRVISTWLKNHVYINGVQAVNGTNCQVRMFNRGAIILPYDSNIKPLTCYTETNYEGESYNNYTEGHSGGFMKTLTDAQLNNKIRSFKLKRGYMVTFAVGTGGWGYSRCFIADLEDLEIADVPSPLNARISSYRLFKWWNASKAGVHDTGKTANDVLNTTSCFDWGQGNATLLPDVEWISHHIYEDWPSASACGSNTGTCHMKTNNEPGNSADDHPQDVATVLGNWENLMRTGMRLCSESSHDGSMNHLKEFINAIDERGWRCDILDLHCYWDGQFNSLDWYIQEYGKGRPCWISEWVWGSSWGNNGAFASGRQSDEATYNGTLPILDKLNSNPRVERYFYWNSEAWYTKIYRDGSLTKLGKYYADMETSLAYNPQYDYVPKIVCQDPGTLSSTLSKTGAITLSWSDINGDMVNSIVVEKKVPGSTKWETTSEITPKDRTTSSGAEYSYTEKLTDPGVYFFRVTIVDMLNKKHTTNEVSATVSAANAIGYLLYGQLKIANTETVTTDFEAQGKIPYVVMGLPSYANTTNGITNHLVSTTKSAFKFRFAPWTLPTAGTITKAESVDYMMLPPDTVLHLSDNMMLISQSAGKVKGDWVQVTFPEEFPEGVTPVVVAQQNTTNTSYAPVTVRIKDVTNKGFMVHLARQEGITSSFINQNVNYFACSPGQIKIGKGKLLTVGRDTETPCGGTSKQTFTLKNTAGEQLTLVNPYMIIASQTDNYEVASVFRVNNASTVDMSQLQQVSIRRQADKSTTSTVSNSASVNGDFMGWIAISDDPEGTGEEAPVIGPIPTGIISTSQSHGFSVSTANGIINTYGDPVRIYNAAGQPVVAGAKVASGMYIVTNGKTSQKIIVK